MAWKKVWLTPRKRKRSVMYDARWYGEDGRMHSMCVGPDKKLVALFRDAIVRIEPGTFKHTRLAKPPVGISVGIVLRDGRLYFTDASRLWSYKVPGL